MKCYWPCKSSFSQKKLEKLWFGPNLGIKFSKITFFGQISAIFGPKLKKNRIFQKIPRAVVKAHHVPRRFDILSGSGSVSVFQRFQFTQISQNLHRVPPVKTKIFEKKSGLLIFFSNCVEKPLRIVWVSISGQTTSLQDQKACAHMLPHRVQCVIFLYIVVFFYLFVFIGSTAVYTGWKGNLFNFGVVSFQFSFAPKWFLSSKL